MPASSKLNIFISHPSHYLTNHTSHGDGLIAYSFLERLADRGHQLHVATSLYSLRGTLPDSITLHPIKMQFAGTPNGLTAGHRIEYAIKVRSLFDRLKKEIAFDLIHQLNPVVLGVSGLLYNPKIPLVMGPYWPSWTNNVVSSRAQRFRRSIQEVAKSLTRELNFHRCDAIISPTAASTDEILSAKTSPSKIFPLNVGIDTSAFSPSAETEPSDPTILFLANPMRRKGIFTLLDAFEKLSARVPKCKLLIAGSGHDITEVNERIGRMQCGPQVSLLGHVPRESVNKVIRGCTVYCLPSFGEPFGMSALEAMAAGKPLVVTNTGGLADLVRDEGGRKVPPGDAGALSNALEEVLTNKSLRQDMGRFNRDLVLRDYAWDRVMDRLESIYATVIARKNKPSFSRELSEQVI